jgi:hypothetical protein
MKATTLGVFMCVFVYIRFCLKLILINYYIVLSENLKCIIFLYMALMATLKAEWPKSFKVLIEKLNI